jgi:hypothetical protein
MCEHASQVVGRDGEQPHGLLVHPEFAQPDAHNKGSRRGDPTPVQNAGEYVETTTELPEILGNYFECCEKTTNIYEGRDGSRSYVLQRLGSVYTDWLYACCDGSLTGIADLIYESLEVLFVAAAELQFAAVVEREEVLAVAMRT